MASDRLTSFAPQPRPVTIGGRVYQVWPARLMDLVELQGHIDAQQPAEDEDLETRIAGLTGLDRDRVLFAEHRKFDDGPALTEPEGHLALSTPKGMAVFLYVALRRGSPGLTVGAAAALLATLNVGDFGSIQRAFYRPNPRPRIERLLGLPEPRPRGEPITWGQAVDGLARSHGWTYEYIFSLTLSEFQNARRHGEPVESGFRPPQHEMDAFRDRMMMAIHGTHAEPSARVMSSAEMAQGPPANRAPEWCQGVPDAIAAWEADHPETPAAE